jgi:glyoxylase-like metal-dependent hydrolase (beta-lactamase superfamily II)
MQDTIEICHLTLGEQATNCYLIWSKYSHQGYVIDPADAGDAISEVVLTEHIDLQGIILTHGHFDHLLALLELQLNFDVPVLLHPEDSFLLDRAEQTAKHFLGRQIDPIPNEFQPIINGQTLPLGDEQLQLVHTPGHTPGSVCVQLTVKNSTISIDHTNYSITTLLFTGDTLFANGIEPLTHQYSSVMRLNSSLHMLSLLEVETLILPGHGESEFLKNALDKVSAGADSLQSEG